MARYIFITGGVVSSLGKGLAASALGALLQARGYKVRLRKLDPYLNVDPGTMSPYQHGEVYVTDAIKEFILKDTEGHDFVLCEIGGTVGDIEGLPFLEAIRQLGNELGRDRTMFVHLTLLPWVPTAGELKTKPTQHSVKELLSVGIQPDLLVCRSGDKEIPANERRKIALFCNVRPERVVEARDVDTIYQVPIAYHEQGFDREVCRYFGLD